MNSAAATPLRLGLVGYGAGGRRFHAPFIDAAEGVQLVGVVARSADRIAEIGSDYPSMPVYGSLAELIAAGVDVVVISTPPQTRRELVLEAIAAGVDVIADKPFAPDAAVARELERAAEDAGVLLNAFHNRRWDADILTLKSVIDSGELGQLRRFESRFDLYEPHTVEFGPGGGVLSDLGSHLIDQALWLFGPVSAVYAELEWVERPGGSVDGGFFVSLTHANGVVSHLTAGKLGRLTGRELRLTGTEGAFRSDGTDVQPAAIFAGLRPADDPDGWGFEQPDRWGSITTAAGERAVPSAQGAWQNYYAQFARAVRGVDAGPVPAAEAVAVVAVIDAARISATEAGSSSPAEPVRTRQAFRTSR